MADYTSTDQDLIGYAIEVTITELERQISNLQDRLAHFSNAQHVLYAKWDSQRVVKGETLKRYRKILDDMYPED